MIATREPVQARSVANTAALMDAVELVLREKSPAQVSVTDLAAAAGVSTSYLYTRFPGKQALMDHVIDSFLSEQRRAGELVLTSGRWTLDLEGRLKWITRQLASTLDMHRGKIRAANERAGGQAPGAWLDLTVVELMRNWLLACRAEIRHDDPGQAVAVALQMIIALMHSSAVQDPDYPGTSVSADEIVRVALSYLVQPVPVLSLPEVDQAD